jgi:hypothetical protein
MGRIDTDFLIVLLALFSDFSKQEFKVVAHDFGIGMIGTEGGFEDGQGWRRWG